MTIIIVLLHLCVNVCVQCVWKGVCVSICMCAFLGRKYLRVEIVTNVFGRRVCVSQSVSVDVSVLYVYAYVCEVCACVCACRYGLG